MTQSSLARLLRSTPAPFFTAAAPFSAARPKTGRRSSRLDCFTSNPWQQLASAGFDHSYFASRSPLEKSNTETSTRARLLAHSSSNMSAQERGKLFRDIDLGLNRGFDLSTTDHLASALLGNARNREFLERLGRTGRVNFDVMVGGKTTPTDHLAMKREPRGVS